MLQSGVRARWQLTLEDGILLCERARQKRAVKLCGSADKIPAYKNGRLSDTLSANEVSVTHGFYELHQFEVAARASANLPSVEGRAREGQHLEGSSMPSSPKSESSVGCPTKDESWRQVPEPVLVPLVVESWRRVPEPALAPLFQEGWRGFPRRTTGAQGHNSLPPEHVSRRLQFVDSGAEPLEFDAATLRLPTSSLQVTTPPKVDFATECCRRGINDGPGYYPDDLNFVESWRRVPEPALAPLFQEGWRGFPRRTTGAQGHNSLPPEHVGRRLQFVDSGAEPLEFDAATLRLPTSSRQVTTPPNVDFATESWPTGDAAQRRLRH
ncbi:hypothetical protein HPB51_003507 [Rhipicephalus microplus]|uniref:Uncharacterized protein n=1 Tax=Rhipicephalus microplus TaxID=6941 RepID=A0A9J6ELM0_RHIMP|nr:hypothetical protein HPB51_003507 [Rhipicephalus microplus]